MSNGSLPASAFFAAAAFVVFWSTCSRVAMPRVASSCDRWACARALAETEFRREAIARQIEDAASVALGNPAEALTTMLAALDEGIRSLETEPKVPLEDVRQKLKAWTTA